MSRSQLNRQIESGRGYLLTRLRRRELATRAPADCPHKNWDGKGEAYLALNVVLALGDQLGRRDRNRLRRRLLNTQVGGAWDYTDGGSGPDADTSASAIRALDRLGESIDLSGIATFVNPDSGLHNTFRVAGEYAGLQLPPQSRERHFGAHPCVLPNVWLLLHERGQLRDLPIDLQSGMQGDDGLWAAYFYLSPYYSTRLLCELLPDSGAAYDEPLRRTLNGLLGSDVPASATQTAEVLISLLEVARRFPERSEEIADRASELAARLRRTQREDGSWDGEVIWRFVHRTHPEPVDGFDHYRVHSTSLAVRALGSWQASCRPRSAGLS